MALLTETFHTAKHALFGKPRRYGQSAKEICQNILEACWDEEKQFYHTSLNNYQCFYARDFGMCVDALLRLDQRERVLQTLIFALNAYKKKGRITQQVGKAGDAFNFPSCEQPDAYAFFLHALISLNDKKLIQESKTFLEEDIARFVKKVVEEKGLYAGLVKKDLRVAGMRDYAIRKSSCYDNVMLAAIAKYCDMLKIKNPLAKYDYHKRLIKHFWTGKYFQDDLFNKELTGDANVAPFWFGVLVNEKKYFFATNTSLRKIRLHEPVALRYEPHKNTSTKMRWLDVLTGGWERDTAWLHLGNMYLDVLKKFDKKMFRAEVKKHVRLVEEFGFYPEVLHPDGKQFKGVFFRADSGMLWAVNLLARI